MRSAFKQWSHRASSWAKSGNGKTMIGNALAVVAGAVSVTVACTAGKPLASEKLHPTASAALDRFGAQVAAEHFSTTSHYTGPPMPPVRPEWSESADGLFTELTEQGYIRVPPMFFPNSFVAGGHGLEHRLQAQLFYKPTEADAKAPAGAAAAVPSPAASTAVTDPSSARASLSIALDGFEPEDAVLLLRGVAKMGPHASGYPGYVHGGCIASIFDSAAGQAVSLSGIKAMTGNLSIDYRRPVPLHTEVELLVAVSGVHGRKARVKFALCDLPEKRQTGTPALVYSEGTALFVVPRAWAAANAKPVPVA